MTGIGTERSVRARHALECFTFLPAVDLRLEGQAMIAAFDVDAGEHRRRSSLGAGAVTSRATLHGLWLLPSGVPVPAEAVPEHKRRRLRDAEHFAHDDGQAFERKYSPAGVVRAIALVAGDARRSIELAAQITPIVQRLVVVDVAFRPSRDLLALAARWGVGVIAESASPCGCEVLSCPSAPVVGVPAVFRWWLAELAYESWLQQSAQPVS